MKSLDDLCRPATDNSLGIKQLEESALLTEEDVALLATYI
jgi:hypothetical protein